MCNCDMNRTGYQSEIPDYVVNECVRWIHIDDVQLQANKVEDNKIVSTQYAEPIMHRSAVKMVVAEM